MKDIFLLQPSSSSAKEQVNITVVNSIRSYANINTRKNHFSNPGVTLLRAGNQMTLARAKQQQRIFPSYTLQRFFKMGRKFSGEMVHHFL